MYAISIAIGPVVWRLLYKTEEKAEDTYQSLTLSGPFTNVQIVDDFGQRAFLPASNALSAVLFEDLEQSKLASVEMALHTTRAQMEANKRAQSDPALRAAALGGPAVISPMGNGRYS